MTFKKIKYNGSTIHYSETANIILGFTETDSEVEDVGEHLGVERFVQLEQVHGNKIFFSDEVKGYPDGDGIILNEKKVLAVIRTADCVPLFFWSTKDQYAGVIHVGWRGLFSKIGINLIKMLKKKGLESPEPEENATWTNDLLFFTGPSIEGKCYTVQQDVVDLFKDFSFSEKIFEKTPEGYSMDVTKGIELCLIENGIPAKNITHSGICTFCDSSFPSYRRGDREKRIFNFIMRKQTDQTCSKFHL